MEKVKILIVEDEFLVAQDMSNKLERAGYEICGAAGNAPKALQLFNSQMPDIVLMDINLRGVEDGIQTAIKMQNLREVPLIFLTALYDDATTQRAKEANPSAYIIKPFNEKQLNIAIEIAMQNFSRMHATTINEEAKEEFPDETYYVLKERIFVKNKGRFEKVLLEDILWIESDRNYSTIVTSNNKHLILVSLGALEEKFENAEFLRVHRSYIVNLKKIDSFEEGRLFIARQEIPIAKSSRDEFIRRFKII